MASLRPPTGSVRPPAKPAKPLTERSWTLIMIGGVLAVSTVSYIWQSAPPADKASSRERMTAAMVPLATGEESTDQLFIKGGCVVCHRIPGVKGADGQVGPVLVLGTTAPRRLADPSYHGAAKTVREYIQESILNPSAYVVNGYPDGVMPQWYGQKLSAGALDKIASYLERLEQSDGEDHDAAPR